MSIAPFSFRELGSGDVEIVSSVQPRSFLPSGGRKKEEAAPPPPPPPPTFSEDQMKESERAGYQKGFLDGIEEGKQQAQSTQAEIDLALTQAVAGFTAHIAPLFDIYRDMLKIQAEQMPKIAHGIARKVAGDALTQNAGTLIADICMRCIKSLAHEPKLNIIVHASLAQTLEEKIKASVGVLPNAPDITVVADANISLPNCRIDWKNGAMLRDTDSLWQQVEQVVNSMVASGAREADEICNTIESTIEASNEPPKGE